MIKYVTGDVLEAKNDEGNFDVIIHCCNNIFVMGSGVALSLRNKWPQVYTEYKSEQHTLKLGGHQWIKVDENKYVINIIGQHGVGPDTNGRAPVRYDALFYALNNLAKEMEENADMFTVHAPRLGSDRAGGKWIIIEAILKATLVDKGINVIIYDLPNTPS